MHERMKKHDLRGLHVDQYKAILALMMVHSVDFVISENFHAPVREKDITFSSFFSPTKKMKWYQGQNFDPFLRLY